MTYETIDHKYRNDCLLSFGERAVPFAADKPVQEERPNILFILRMIILPSLGAFTGGCWVIMPGTRISVAWLRRAAC